MSATDGELDARVRRTLASRDPGEAPASLRHRVAAVTDTPTARRSAWSWLPVFTRPAVAFIATGAAVVLGLVIAATLARPLAAPGPSAGPGANGPGPAPDLAVSGYPLALPLALGIWVALIALLAGWFALELYVARAAPASRSFPIPRRRSRRGLVFLVLTGFVLVGGQVIRFEASLGAGSFFEASLVHLEGMRARQPAIGVGDEAWYHYVPGSPVTVVQAVRNGGSLPITVTGTDGTDSGIELRLFAVHDPSGPLDVDTMPTYPFQPFELAPGEERELVVAFHLAACPGVPVPSPEPSPDLSGSFEPASPYASMNFANVGLSYSVLGFEREVEVPFFATVVVDSPNGSVCALDQGWASPTPSIPSPSPSPR